MAHQTGNLMLERELKSRFALVENRLATSRLGKGNVAGPGFRCKQRIDCKGTLRLKNQSGLAACHRIRQAVTCVNFLSF